MHSLGIILFVYFGVMNLIDMHYDLLSILYYSYLRNDFKYVKELQKYFNDNNVRGLIANLYFMSEREMAQEMMGKAIDVVEMFKVSTELFKKYFPNIDVVFSIEGCDYIKDIKELKQLYDLGLRSILLVWNNKNKYGSGAKATGGLTEEGKNFIIEAIKLGITIDLSHMNKETFIDTVDLLKDAKKNGLNPKVIVSHSNVADLYSHPRNITENQISSLSEFSPVIGLVSYAMFLTKEEQDTEVLKHKYLEHIKRVVEILGIDAVGVSTDDMGYDNVLFDNPVEKIILPYEKLKDELTKLLREEFSEEEIAKILYLNIKNKLFREEEK